MKHIDTMLSVFQRHSCICQVIIWTPEGPISYASESLIVIFLPWYNCYVYVLNGNKMFLNWKKKNWKYLFGVATANRTKVTTSNKYGAEIIRWRPSQKRRAAGHNRQHVISRRLRVLPTCPEWLRLSPGLPSPAEAGLWQLTQGSRYGSHHARSLETSWRIGNKNCQIIRHTHCKLCYM